MRSGFADELVLQEGMHVLPSNAVTLQQSQTQTLFPGWVPSWDWELCADHEQDDSVVVLPQVPLPAPVP